MENAQELVDQNLIPVAAQRMWTSTLTLQDREFCFILNWAVREDVEELADSVAMLTRAISELCVTGGLTDHAAVHPESNICYRGGGFDDDFRSFFVERRKFRIPNYLATSFSESVTKTFLRRVAADTPKVLWLIHIDPDEKCHHVNLVKKTNVEGEQEYLFAPCKPRHHAFMCVSRRLGTGSLTCYVTCW
jgi:hypothetical protein